VLLAQLSPEQLDEYLAPGDFVCLFVEKRWLLNPAHN